MSPEEDCDIKRLKKYNTALETELDKKNQQLYDLQRKLKESEILRLNEVELLQAELDSNDAKKLNAQIIQLKEVISEVRTTCDKNTCSLELELQSKDEEILKLKSELKELLKYRNNDSLNPESESTVYEELFSLRQENEALQNTVEELKEELLEKQNRLSQTECALNKGQEELTETTECFNATKEQLAEAQVLIEKLKDELSSANNELDNFKRRPLDQESKGNSLFAEVDDRRVYLQKKIDDMKSDYIFLKKERGEHLKQIAYLRTEMASLTKQYENDIKEIEIDKHEIDKAVKKRIEILEQIIESNKNENNMPNIDNEFDEMTAFQRFLKHKDKELNGLKEKLASQALNQVLLSTALAQANRETRKWRREAIEKENEKKLKEINDVLNTADEPKSKQIKKELIQKEPNCKVVESKTRNVDISSRRRLLSASKILIGTGNDQPEKISIKNEPIDEVELKDETDLSRKLYAKENKENQEQCYDTAKRTGAIKKSCDSEGQNAGHSAIKGNKVTLPVENEKPIKSVTFNSTLPVDESNKSKPRRIPGKVIISKPIFINTKPRQ